MRIKGYCKGKRKITRKPAGVVEIDCGMGMTEIRKEIECFTFPAKMDRYTPAWKKPVLAVSLCAAAVGMGLGITFMAAVPAFGALFIASFAWVAFVGYANR